MNKKQKIAIGINIFTAITQLVVSSILIIRRGFAAFGYYTMDSNIFAAVTSIFLIISLLTKKEVSERIHNFRYYSTCCVTLTFLVVITILVPMDGWHTLPNRLFMGTDLWLHTVGPLLNIVSFIFFERENTLSKKQPLLAIIPTIIYAIFAIILNLLKVIDGPYFFLKIYEQPIWEVIMWLAIIGILVFIIALILKKATSTKK